MSSSGILSPFPNPKIFDELLPNPYPYPAQPPSLAQVLVAGDDAGNGNIENLLQLQATNIVQQAQIGGHLTIGGTPSNPGSGGDLRIQGATDKGNILAGNGTSTVGLPVGANGLVLTTNSATTTGLEWAVGGGGGGVASVSAGLNIGITGTGANPIVGVLSPLTSTLNLGTQNTTGTTGALTYDDTVANSKGVLGAISLILSDSTFATGDQTQTNKSGYSAIGSTDTTTHTKTGLSKTAGATDLTLLNSVASQNIALNTTSGIITTNCAIKPTAIRDSASSDGTSGQVLTAGTGGQLLWGTNGVSSITAGSNIGITGTASVPVVGVLNPLTSVLNIGTQNITGTSGTISMTNSVGTGSKASITGLQIEVADNTTATTTVQLSKTGLSAQDASTACSYTKSAITKTTGNLTIQTISGQISSIASSDNVIQGGNSINLYATGGSSKVVVNQLSSSLPKLITEITNVIYYPTYLVDNNNTNSVSIPPPQIQGERLTLVNKGITPTSSWADYGNNYGAGANAVYFSNSTSQVWVARTDTNTIQIYDTTLVNILGNITLSGWAERAYCFYETGGYMYIGGSFQSVNGNATPQFGLTRVNLYNYIEDPIYDPANTIYGVDCGGGGTGVYAIYDYNSTLICGGLFTNFYPNSAPTNNLFYVSNYTGAGGSQVYYEAFGGTNGKVNALFNANGYLWVGGDFTFVNNNTNAYNYLATYNGVWDYVSGNTFNGAVNVINNTNSYPYLLVGGVFTSPHSYICYVDYNTPNNSATDTTLSITAPINRGCIFYNGQQYLFTTTQGVYFSSSFQFWTNQGTPIAGNPSFVGVFAGEAKVAYDNYSFFQSRSNVSQVASFVLSSGNFKFNTTSYTTAFLSITDIGWDFVGDLTSGAVWRQSSYNPWGGYS